MTAADLLKQVLQQGGKVTVFVVVGPQAGQLRVYLDQTKADEEQAKSCSAHGVRPHAAHKVEVQL
jgi:hypothetical protein